MKDIILHLCWKNKTVMEQFKEYKSLNDFQNVSNIEVQYSNEFISANEAIVLENNETNVLVGITENTTEETKNNLEKFHFPKNVTFLNVQRTELVSFIGSISDILATSSDINTIVYNQDFTLDSIEQDAPVVNIINAIIIEALHYKASDIHIELKNQNIHIRYRIDGLLKTVKTLSAEVFPALSSRIKIMSKLNIMEQRLPQDGRMSVTIENSPIDIRVSIIPVPNGEAISLRLFNINTDIMSLDDLGFSDECMKTLTNAIKLPHGLILVTGPTGSGKTTTLHSLLKLLPVNELEVITLEDPIEQVIPEITQIQINEHIGLTFESMLRRVLRHDPDVIMIGEIRDSATAELAIRAALTGHLILATLHTNDSISAISRLLDMGIKPYLLGSVLRCVEAQRLVRRLCPYCAQQIDFSTEILDLCNKFSISPKVMKKPVGCKKCFGTGYLGRTVIAEQYFHSTKLEEYISQKKNFTEIEDYLKNQGMVSMLQDGIQKTVNGITTFDEIKREIGEKDAIV